MQRRSARCESGRAETITDDFYPPMTCPRCARVNAPDAAFCQECGGRLEVKVVNPPHQRQILCGGRLRMVWSDDP